MNELLLILGTGLALDFLLSRIIPKRPRPTIRAEESPSGTILVCPELLTESEIEQLRRDWEKLYHGPCNAFQTSVLEESPSGNTTSKNVKKAQEAVRKVRVSPILNNPGSLPVERAFRVIADEAASPLDLAEYMPIEYGGTLAEMPQFICVSVEYEFQYKAGKHSVWEVCFTFGLRDENGILEYANADFTPFDCTLTVLLPPLMHATYARLQSWPVLLLQSFDARLCGCANDLECAVVLPCRIDSFE